MQDDLGAALADTRKALMTGDIAALADLTLRTEQALGDFMPEDAAALEVLRRQAEGNARCLSAALAGLRAARTRLTEIARLNTTIGYDDRGQRRSLSAPEGLARRL